jgi:hypothetical protein
VGGWVCFSALVFEREAVERRRKIKRKRKRIWG